MLPSDTHVKLRHPRLDWKAGNHLELLENGVELFPALCKAFDAATTSIHMETYIFRLDEAGSTIANHLCLAAARGVKVRVVIDGFGCAENDLEIQARLEAGGVHCRIYRPEPRHFALFVFNTMRLRRLHRKLTVVDSHVAFIGGINIENDYSADELKAVEDNIRRLDPSLLDPRFDYAVSVTGPVVSEILYAQELLWLRLNFTQAALGLDVEAPENSGRHKWHLWLKRSPRHSKSNARAGTVTAALTLRDNLRYRKTIEASYLSAIAAAQTDIIIANAYFLPGFSLRHALIAAANRGVRVRLLLQGKVEYRMQYHATRWIYDQFLKEGIEIYEYLPSFLHAKVAVIDAVSIVGSSNLDPFSLFLAREANLVIDDEAFAKRLRQSLETAMTKGSRIIEHSLYGQRGWFTRLSDALAYKLLRFGVSLSGRGNDDEY